MFDWKKNRSTVPATHRNDFPSARVWWLHPGFALGFPVVVVLAAAYAMPPETYALFWRTGKFIDRGLWFTGMLCAAAFVLGTVLFPSPESKSVGKAPDLKTSIPWHVVRRLVTFSFVLCLFGYLFWSIAAIRQGLTLSIVIDGLIGRNNAVYALKDEYLVPVSGVTSLTQFGIAAIAFGIPAGMLSGWKGIRGKLVVVFLLAVFRAAVNSEREALIELAVPAIVSAVALRHVLGRASKRERVLTATAPVAAGVVLFLLFSGFEYSRSWTFYSQSESNFWRFAAFRLTGYYSTAVNNGALLVRSLPHFTGFPYFTAQFAWKFPVVKNLVEAVFPAVNFNQDSFIDLLSSSANVEFNNPGGLYMPVADFGTAGGCLYWLCAGLVCGYLYNLLLRRGAAGIFIYPVLFISLIEASRVLYWSDGRFFAPFFLIAFSLLFLLRNQNQPLIGVTDSFEPDSGEAPLFRLPGPTISIQPSTENLQPSGKESSF